MSIVADLACVYEAIQKPGLGNLEAFSDDLVLLERTTHAYLSGPAEFARARRLADQVNASHSCDVDIAGWALFDDVDQSDDQTRILAIRR